MLLYLYCTDKITLKGELTYNKWLQNFRCFPCGSDNGRCFCTCRSVDSSPNSATDKKLFNIDPDDVLYIVLKFQSSIAKVNDELCAQIIARPNDAEWKYSFDWSTMIMAPVPQYLYLPPAKTENLSAVDIGLPKKIYRLEIFGILLRDAISKIWQRQPKTSATPGTLPTIASRPHNRNKNPRTSVRGFLSNIQNLQRRGFIPRHQ